MTDVRGGKVLAPVAVALLVLVGSCTQEPGGYQVVQSPDDPGVRFLRASGEEMLAVEAELRPDPAPGWHRLWVAFDPGDEVDVTSLTMEIGNLENPSAAGLLPAPAADAPPAIFGVSGPDRVQLQLPEGTGAAGSTTVKELVVAGGAPDPWLRVEATLEGEAVPAGEVPVLSWESVPER